MRHAVGIRLVGLAHGLPHWRPCCTCGRIGHGAPVIGSAAQRQAMEHHRRMSKRGSTASDLWPKKEKASG